MILFRLISTFLISYTLILAPIGSNSFAFAEEPTIAPTITEAPDTEASDAISTDVTGKTSQSMGGENGEGYIELLTMLAIAYVNAMWAIDCSGSALSPWVSIAAALVYIAAEVVAWIQYSSLNKEIEKINSAGTDLTGDGTETTDLNANPYDSQITKYELTRDALDGELDIVKTKKTLVIVAASGFALAVIVAIIEAATADSTSVLAGAGQAIGRFICVGQSDVNISKPSGSQYYAHSLDQIMNHKDITLPEQHLASYQKQLKNKLSNPQSYFLLKEFREMKQGKNRSPSITDYTQFQSIYEGTIGQADRNQDWSQFLSVALNMMTPVNEAHAGSSMTSLLGMAGVTYLAFKAIKKSEKVIEDRLVMDSHSRIYLHGIHAALATLCAVFLNNDQKRIEDNKETLTGTIDDLKEMKANNPAAGYDPTKLGGSAVEYYTPKEFTYKQPDLLKEGCMDRQQKLISCKDCRGRNSCTKFKKTNLSGLGTLPSIINTSSAGLTDINNDLASGKLKDALLKAEVINQNAAKIARLKDKMLDKLNKDIVAGGGAPVNFQQHIDKGLGKLLANAARTSKKAGGKGTLSGNALAKIKAARDAMAKEKALAAKDGIKKGGVTAGAAGAMKSGAAPGGANDFGLDFGLDDEDALGSLATGTEEQMNIDEFKDINLQDIRKSPDENLFKIISTRYLKSYPRVLEEEIVVDKRTTKKEQTLEELIDSKKK